MIQMNDLEAESLINNVESYPVDYVAERIDYIYKYFDKYGNSKFEKRYIFLIKSIGMIKDIELKVSFIKKYFYCNHFNTDEKLLVETFYISSVLEIIRYDKYWDKIKILKLLFGDTKFIDFDKLLSVSSDIHFGVELEYHYPSINLIENLFSTKKLRLVCNALGVPKEHIDFLLNNYGIDLKDDYSKWNFTIEGYDKSPEASSPILSNNKFSLNQINVMVLLFNIFGSRINGGFSLHINIGVDVFKNNINALKNLLLIWGEAEKILFKMSNPIYDTPRIIASLMAKYIADNINITLQENPDFTINNEEEFLRFIYNIQVRDKLVDLFGFENYQLENDYNDAKTEDEKFEIFKKYMVEKSQDDNSIKYVSMNFLNMNWGSDNPGRIEIRVCNNSLSMQTIYEDINLFTSLFDVATKLAEDLNYKKEEFVQFLKHDINEIDKVNALLNLLFDDDNIKEIYSKRWLSVYDDAYFRCDKNIPSTYKETFGDAKLSRKRVS